MLEIFPPCSCGNISIFYLFKVRQKHLFLCIELFGNVFRQESSKKSHTLITKELNFSVEFKFI